MKRSLNHFCHVSAVIIFFCIMIRSTLIDWLADLKMGRCSFDWVSEWGCSIGWMNGCVGRYLIDRKIDWLTWGISDSMSGWVNVSLLEGPIIHEKKGVYIRGDGRIANTPNYEWVWDSYQRPTPHLSQMDSHFSSVLSNQLKAPTFMLARTFQTLHFCLLLYNHY